MATRDEAEEMYAKGKAIRVAPRFHGGKVLDCTCTGRMSIELVAFEGYRFRPIVTLPSGNEYRPELYEIVQ